MRGCHGEGHRGAVYKVMHTVYQNPCLSMITEPNVIAYISFYSIAVGYLLKFL